MDDSRRIVDADVLVQDGRIKRVGKLDGGKVGKKPALLDCTGLVVLPGLILLRPQTSNAFLPRPCIEFEPFPVHLEMLPFMLQRRERSNARRELGLEILTMQWQVFYLSLDLFDLLLPILQDEQLLQFRLHARMLWAEGSGVNCRRVEKKQRSPDHRRKERGGLEKRPFC